MDPEKTVRVNLNKMNAKMKDAPARAGKGEPANKAAVEHEKPKSQPEAPKPKG